MKRVLILCFVMMAGLAFTPKIAFAACTTEAQCYSLAKKGDADAQYTLGLIYFNGDGTAQDYPEAQKWFRKAAEQRHIDAQYILGYMYINNLGVPLAYDKALAPYMKDFEKGYGSVYNRKNISAYLAAAKRYQKIIDSGYDDAFNAKNTKYNNRIIQWVQKIFNLGFKDALNKYKRALEGLKEGNYTEALKWFQFSAKKGNSDAQYQLGLMYAKGQGVKQNFVESYAWIAISAAQGNRDAEKALERIIKQLSKREFASAQRLAKDYYRKYVKPFQ